MGRNSGKANTGGASDPTSHDATSSFNGIEGLLQVMARLRDPDSGCPWDVEQTYETIAPYTIEEAYEVADAIERKDVSALKEELGDLLLQVVFHSRIAQEENAFTFEDVVDAITAKMIRRHPHVFGNKEEREAGAADGFWERIKSEERMAKISSASNAASPVSSSASGTSVSDASVPGASVQGASVPGTSALDDVPMVLPALTRAIKLQNKAARVGFDWPSLEPVFAKMKEELGELEEVVAEGNLKRIEEEYGDLLFVIANVARHLKIDPEHALRGTNAKFTRRFHRIEALLAQQGKTPIESNLQEMDGFWDQAKLEERAGES